MLFVLKFVALSISSLFTGFSNYIIFTYIVYTQNFNTVDFLCLIKLYLGKIFIGTVDGTIGPYLYLCIYP